MPKPRRKKAPSPPRKKSAASAFSTGGGGNAFEQQVGTFYAAALLMESCPRGHEGGVVREVRFQRRFVDGDPMDDVVLLLDVPSAPDQTARLSLQLKHDLEWGDNTLFNEVIAACWERFASPDFHFGFDKFGIGVGVSKATYRFYQKAIEQAARSATAADFLRKIEAIEARTCGQFVGLIRARLNAHVASKGREGEITDEELWRFVRSMALLRLDVMEADSRDRYDAIERLRFQLSLSTPRKAADLWEKLYGLVAAGLPLAASFTREQIVHELKLKGVAFASPRAASESPTEEAPAPAPNAGIQGASVATDSLARSLGGRLPDDSTQRIVREARLDATVDNARKLLEKGRIENARELLLEVRESKEAPLSPALLFRVAANLGACALEMEDAATAARECRSAYRQQPQSVKAMTIGAQAELVDGKPEEAIPLCEEALRQEPRSTDAALIYVQALHQAGRDEELESFLTRELWIKDDPSCATALAQVRAEQGREEEAMRLLGDACDKEPKDPQARSLLAFHLIQRARRQIAHDPALVWREPPQAKKDIEEAIGSLSVAVKYFEKHDNKRRLHLNLANRAAAYGLLNEDELGLKDCEWVLAEDGSHRTALINKGWLLLRQGDDQGAIEALSKIKDGGVEPQAARSLALANMRRGEWAQAFQVLAPVVEGDPRTPEQFDLLDLWAHAGHESGREDEVRQALAALEAAQPDDPEALLVRSKHALRTGKYSHGIALLRRAVEGSTGRQKDRMALSLAEAFYSNRRYAAAVPFYRQVVDESRPNAFLEHYVVALLKSRQPREALRVARLVRGHGKAVPVYSEIEAGLADEAGDWKLAIRLRRELCEIEPRKASHRLRRAIMEFHEGNVAEARQVLRDIPPGLYENDAALAMDIAQARVVLDVPGALELAYQTRRAHVGDAGVHFRYLAIFQQRARQDDPTLSPIESRVGCALLIESKGQRAARLLVEGRPVLPEEVSVDEPRGRELLGRRVGDAVVFKKGTLGMADEAGTVAEVQHNFVYAFQDTIARFRMGQIEHPAIASGQLPEDPQEFLQGQSRALRERRHHAEEIADLYRRLRLPLSTLAATQGRALYEFWSQIGSVGGRFYCASGEPSHILRSRAPLRQAQGLVLDPTALFTIALLEIEEEVKARFPRLLVAHAAWSEIREHCIQEKLNPAPNGFLYSDGVNLRYHEVPRDEVEKRHRFLERVLGFIEKKTEVLPVYSLLEQDPRVVKSVGEGTLASMLLAGEQKLPLYSDDLRVRELALWQNGVDGVYCWPVLSSLMPSLGKEALFDAIWKLILHGYTFLYAMHDLLVHGLKRNEMRVSPDVRAVLHRMLGGRDASLEWAARRAAGLLAQVWGERLLVQKWQSILGAVLEAFLSQRSTYTALLSLQESLTGVLPLEPLAQEQIKLDIEAWCRDNLQLVNRGSQLERVGLEVPPLEVTLDLSNPNMHH